MLSITTSSFLAIQEAAKDIHISKTTPLLKAYCD